MPENQEISHNMREKLYYASVLAGIALGRCGTCYCHRLGYYLTENYDVAHGTACAVFLPGFIRRANKLMPQRAQVFFADIRCDEKTLCDLIEFLNLKPKIKFDTDTIAEIAKRGTGSVTFSNTAPEGFGEQDAIEALKIFA